MARPRDGNLGGPPPRAIPPVARADRWGPVRVRGRRMRAGPSRLPLRRGLSVGTRPERRLRPRARCTAPAPRDSVEHPPLVGGRRDGRGPPRVPGRRSGLRTRLAGSSRLGLSRRPALGRPRVGGGSAGPPVPSSPEDALVLRSPRERVGTGCCKRSVIADEARAAAAPRDPSSRCRPPPGTGPPRSSNRGRPGSALGRTGSRASARTAGPAPPPGADPGGIGPADHDPIDRGKSATSGPSSSIRSDAQKSGPCCARTLEYSPPGPTRPRLAPFIHEGIANESRIRRVGLADLRAAGAWPSRLWAPTEITVSRRTRDRRFRSTRNRARDSSTERGGERSFGPFNDGVTTATATW